MLANNNENRKSIKSIQSLVLCQTFLEKTKEDKKFGFLLKQKRKKEKKEKKERKAMERKSSKS